MATKMADPLGHQLLEARIQSVPQYVRWMSRANEPHAEPVARPGRVTATGTGSSEAHARYLVALLNRYTDVPGEFVSLSRFAEESSVSGDTLVVFSQGLSRGVRLALAHRKNFPRLVLFTSATEEGLKEAGKADRATLLAGLKSSGAEIFQFPLEHEYTILIRIVGPACGFLTARRWVRQIAGNRLPELSSNAILDTWVTAAGAAPVTEFLNGRQTVKNGVVILGNSFLAETGHNLVCKFIEGLYCVPPQLMDLLSFAHGPFQQLATDPRPVVILSGSPATEQELTARAVEMCRSIGITPILVPLRGCPSLTPFEAEALFNPVLLRLVQQTGVNQVDWPGKGLDTPLYEYP
jgi:hypothetical protein